MVTAYWQVSFESAYKPHLPCHLSLCGSDGCKQLSIMVTAYWQVGQGECAAFCRTCCPSSCLIHAAKYMPR